MFTYVVEVLHRFCQPSRRTSHVWKWMIISIGLSRLEVAGIYVGWAIFSSKVESVKRLKNNKVRFQVHRNDFIGRYKNIWRTFIKIRAKIKSSLLLNDVTYKKTDSHWKIQYKCNRFESSVSTCTFTLIFKLFLSLFYSLFRISCISYSE